jgi:hypothetical protein
MVQKMERILSLETKDKRKLICLRLDAGFGTDENINYALWRDYHLLVKMYSGNRAKVLAKSVQEWVDISPGPDNRPRQAGWVSAPHRYCRKTRQLAIRMHKKKGDGYKHSVLVITDMNADLHATVSDYDGRSGVPESTFCQDNQGLGNRKRRKRGFVAQQMLTLLTQLAHNLIRWVQNWLAKAVDGMAKYSTSSSSEANSDDWWIPASAPVPNDADLAIATLNSFGMKRFVRQVLCLSGVVVVRKGKVRQVKFNPLYPLISRIVIAFEALLTPHGIAVSLYEI